MNIPQLLGGLIFIWTVEGAAILVVAVATLVIAGQIHRRMPFSRLTGLCHVPWLALLPWLVYRLLTVDHSLALDLWLIYVAITILISLIFDVLDTVRYLGGNKKFAWAK